ncbi:MAG: ferric reductase-like transmembrane domain-containing protein [Rhodovarius sp.]|nr:ferric reductase-like transmembrane domain-containing protein [Rhodovarius sp.]
MTLPPLLLLLLALSLLPVLLGWLLVGPARPWTDELAAAAGLAGLSLLLLGFVLSGRFPLYPPMPMDRVLRLHRNLALLAGLALLLLHPFLYSTPDGAAMQRPDDPTHAQALGLGGEGILTGMLAWLLLALLLVTALRRADLPWSYEAWRAWHGWSGLVMAGLAVHHALHVGRYARDPVVAAVLVAFLGLGGLSLLYVWLLRPLLLARRPWRIAALTPLAERSWELVLEPLGHPGLSYRPGQFAWLRLATGPLSRREHPFTIASAPAEGSRLRFVVKEVGDFTRSIGRLPVGARAYVDGPHGALAQGLEGAAGLVFLCGGIGIAPALAMLRQAAAEGDGRPKLLVWGNRRPSQIFAEEELAAVPGLRIVHVLSEPPPGWQGEVGVLDSERIRRLVAAEAAAGHAFVLCGPGAMLDEARRGLRALGVPPGRIHSERFD